MKKLLFPILMLVFLTACTPDPNDQFIQGAWVFAEDETGDAYLKKYWVFDRGYFSFTDEVALGKLNENVEGRYRIIESSSDKITLELYMIQGGGRLSDPSQILITIDREANTTVINRVPYQRQR